MDKALAWLMNCIFACSIVFLSGCHPSAVQGNGLVTQESRTVAPFTRIRIDGNYKVLIVAGQTDGIDVSADSNLLPYLQTALKGDTLFVTAPNNLVLAPSKIPEIIIHTPHLEQLTVNGDNLLQIKNLTDPTFTVNINGAGNAQLSGQVDHLTLHVAGSTTVDARALQVKQSNITVKGSSIVQVNTKETLSAEVMGSGRIQYQGTPEMLAEKVVGNGRIEMAS